VVLAKFDELMSSTTPSAPEVEQFIDQIEGHIEAAEKQTHRRIDTLSEQVQDHVESEEIGLSDPEQQQIRAHRMQFSIFVERLAELAQELMQPLTVINCSIKMTTSGYVGELSEEQKDLLDLAQSSANRLNRLIERLTTLVGYPKDLNPKTSEIDED
jgi:signal transduction histidine kinase